MAFKDKELHGRKGVLHLSHVASINGEAEALSRVDAKGRRMGRSECLKQRPIQPKAMHGVGREKGRGWGRLFKSGV
jgi:hypothetical protein